MAQKFRTMRAPLRGSRAPETSPSLQEGLFRELVPLRFESFETIVPSNPHSSVPQVMPLRSAS